MEEELKTSVSDELIASFEKKYKDKKQAEHHSFVFRFIVLICVLLALCVSPFLPTFSCRNTIIKGNYLLDAKEILGYANYKTSTPLLFLDEKKVEEAAKQKEYIASIDVKWNLLGIEIQVDEIACVLKKEENGKVSYLLSNDTTLEDFQNLYPTSTYDFKEEETPLLLSDFSFSNQDHNEYESANRRKKVLSHLKEIAPKILRQVQYFEIIYTKDKTNLLFAFYFPSKIDTYGYDRILMRDEAFSFFLEEKRLESILHRIQEFYQKFDADSEKNPNSMIYNHATITSLSYTNTVCTYDGKENRCRLSTK